MASYNEQVSHSDDGREFIRISKLATVMNWNRAKTYYWLARCPDVEVFSIAGVRMVRQEHLTQIILRLKQVHEEAMIKRGFRD